MRIIDIINEELKNWFDDEPSIADKYYEKNLNITKKPINKETDYSGELIGYVNHQWHEELPQPIPIIKNPTSLTNFDNNCRGVLTQDGNLYMSTSIEGFHDNILKLLYEKGLIYPNFAFSMYYKTCPEEFIAVSRINNTNTIQIHNIYDFYDDDEIKVPLYYQELMEYANNKSNLTFTT
jgi:hypothetical protein